MASWKQLVSAIAVTVPAAAGLYQNGSVIAPCDSEIYCHGEMLKEIQLAKAFTDSKTFVDMPAKKPLSQIKNAFDKLDKPLSNNTALNDFLSEYFEDAGGELEQVPKDQLETDPKFLNAVNDTVIKEFVGKVIDIWPDLTRKYAGSGSNCTNCPNSFIPINHTFVVAGGRFREPYYWDSYWIVEGLLRTGGSFIGISKDIIDNFLDIVDKYGFVPNGARIYYLNRSQPPLLSHMVKAYIDSTNDTQILGRAVPLLVKEHDFFVTNRSVEVTVDDKTYQLQQYAVSNTQPRPESYREDYFTATNNSFHAESGIIYPVTKPLNETEIAELYANLATGAESGLDYSAAKWAKYPGDAMRENYFPLRSLNNKNIIPVDLNSILYGNEVIISDLYKQTGNESASQEWADKASNRSEAIQAVFWNETLYSYFDYNLTSSAQHMYVPRDDDTQVFENSTAPAGYQELFAVTQFYPFWTGAAPKHLKNNPHAVKTAFSRVAKYLDATVGGIPSTNVKTGEQWDQPNVWPPLMHILMQGLMNTPATFGEDDPAYKDVHDLALRLAQRYLDSTFCTWYATGGSTSETPQLEGLTSEDVGIMFEKYDDNSTNHAGGGGEYEVVEGFGWTNGVLIWAVDTFKNELRRPQCGNITAANVYSTKRSLSAVQISHADARRVKRFASKKSVEMS